MKKSKKEKVSKKSKRIVKVKDIAAQKPVALSKNISPEIEKASGVAKYYGFSQLPEIIIESQDIALAKKFGESHLKHLHPFKDKGSRFGGFLEEKIAILRSFMEKKFLGFSQPIMGFYEAPLKGNPHMKKNLDEETFNLEIIGSGKSITEATLIETAFIILKERYPEYEFSLQINSIGDKESINRYARELGNFCKKESCNLSKTCKALIKKDVFSVFDCDHKGCLAALEEAPKPMSYLSESSRTHFKEVLEYLESLNVPYTINPCLLGSRSYCSETVFEIIAKNEKEEIVIAIGERYSGLAKKVWGKKDIQAVGIALLIHPHFVKRGKKIKEKTKVAKFFFIQFGFDAKLKSLALIEMLRQANISVEQSLSKDKLSVQLTYAEKINIPYVLIMGQKEAKEDSIVVRNLQSRSQETVMVSELVHYLKKLK